MVISFGQRLAVVTIAVFAVSLAAILGFSPVSTMDTPTLFARASVSCGAAWDPDYSQATTTGVATCAAIAEPRIVVSAAFLLIAGIAALVVAVTRPARPARAGEVPPGSAGR